MRYAITVEKRENSQGMKSVYLSFNHYGRRFKVSTGIVTAETLTGMTFSKTEKDWRLKTAKLTRIIGEVDKYLAYHDKEPYRAQEAALKRIIRGGGINDGKQRLCEAFPGFIATKDKASTAAVYMDTMRILEDYDPMAFVEDVDVGWLKNFEAWMRREGHNTNGIGKHMRNLRALMNWLITEGRTAEYPFRRYKIKAEMKRPTTLTAEQLATLRDLPLPKHLTKYRDIFMLSFYLCGINMVDLLKVKNLTNGRMMYTRQKTGKHISLPVCDEAMTIIKRYKGRGQLLNILDGMTDYHAFTKAANKALKKIGPVEHVSHPPRSGVNTVYHPLYPWLTMYTARYTFATLAASIGIPRETIALCLGHSWADVTAHYIAYDQRMVDEAVYKVVDLVRRTSGQWMEEKKRGGY